MARGLYCPMHDREYGLWPCPECEKQRREEQLAEALKRWEQPLPESPEEKT